MNLTEKQIHSQICEYLKVFHSFTLFNTDMSGMRLTMGQSVQAKKLRSCNGFPDIVIYETYFKIESGGTIPIYNALFLEVKKESPFKKDGNLKKNKHLEEQAVLHARLKRRGFKVEFVWSFEMAKKIIDGYIQ